MITLKHKSQMMVDLVELEKLATEILADNSVSPKIKDFVKIEVKIFNELIDTFSPERLLK